MAQSARRLPRGINFILGGFVVALAVVLFAVLGGPLDFNLGGAPEVRIDGPASPANAESR